MKFKDLYLENFRGYRKAKFEFGDFSCLIGPNGIGKTSVLEAISLLCSSLEFETEVADEGEADWMPRITASERRAAFLRKNIRNIDEAEAAKGFLLAASIEHAGRSHEVVLSHKGFESEPMSARPWWWAGICYFTRFDHDTNIFALPMELWPQFSELWRSVTGIAIEPDEHIVAPRAEEEFAASVQQESGKRYATGFWMEKDGRVHSRKCSAGERKIAKALSQIVCLPPERMPHVILVDNIEMHVYYKRHLAAVDAIKSIFADRQIISTTHSTVVMSEYQPREHLIDVEEVRERGAE